MDQNRAQDNPQDKKQPSSNRPATRLDPRICCALEICCPPPQAREAKRALIYELIGYADLVDSMEAKMKELDIEFAPGELMRAIRNLADHPNSKVKERGGNISPEEAEKFDLNSEG